MDHLNTFPELVKQDFAKINKDMGAIVNYHEACSVLRYAYETVWEHVKEEQTVDIESLVYLAALAQKIAEDLYLTPIERSEEEKTTITEQRNHQIESELRTVLGLMRAFPKKAEPLQKGEAPSWYFKYNLDLMKKISDALLHPNE